MTSSVLVLCCVAFGVTGWASSSSGSVLALAPIINSDPAPGRSPGPPPVQRHSDLVEGIAQVVEGRNPNENYRRSGNEVLPLRRHPLRKMAKKKRRLSRWFNKSVAVRDSAALVMNSNNEFETKTQPAPDPTKDADHSDELQRRFARRSLRRQRTTSVADKNKVAKAHSANYYYYPSQTTTTLHGSDKDVVAQELDDDDDDWHYVNLYCGGDTDSERGSLRASFFDRLNEVIITLAPQDNRLLPQLQPPPVTTKNHDNNSSWAPEGLSSPDDGGGSKSMSGQARKQLTTSSEPKTTRPQVPRGSDVNTGGGDSRWRAGHRFQKISTPSGTMPGFNQNPDALAKPNGMEQLVIGYQEEVDAEEEEVPVNRRRLMDRVNRNQRLPLQFDVTHQVFDARAGLVTDVEYSGELGHHWAFLGDGKLLVVLALRSFVGRVVIVIIWLWCGTLTHSVSQPVSQLASQ